MVLAVLLSLPGCDAGTTEILVVVDSDLRIPDDIDNLRAEITDPGGAVRMSDARFGFDEPSLPRTLGMVHEGGPFGPYDVVVRGRLGDTAVVSRSARVSFVSGEIHVLRMFLLADCIGETCGTGMTCGDTGCRSITVAPDELTLWTGEVPRIPGDAGAPPDGGMDGAVDAAVDGGLCPDECNGGCDMGTCTIIGATDSRDLRCPDGMPCRVDCSLDMSCPRRIQCASDGSPCVVDCSGADSCARSIDCVSASTCSITCDGASSCADDNNCRDSPMCTIDCLGVDSCAGSQQCRAAGPCSVTCSGERSCAGRGSCETAACTFLCSGIDVCAAGVSCADSCACLANCAGGTACATPSVCPTGCMSGNGCDGTSGACNTCI